jgi:hypothetical protein
VPDGTDTGSRNLKRVDEKCGQLGPFMRFFGFGRPSRGIVAGNGSSVTIIIVSSDGAHANKKRCKRVKAGGVDGGGDSETLIASAASKHNKRPWRNWQTR